MVLTTPVLFQATLTTKTSQEILQSRLNAWPAAIRTPITSNCTTKAAHLGAQEQPSQTNAQTQPKKKSRRKTKCTIVDNGELPEPTSTNPPDVTSASAPTTNETVD
ncbi:hypothetical protein PCANC_25247 [Puccinia coronata f. sp. avenae]|uniref:Uncharacterized protein n=1 Tax=Puccinia coronata f. sp. avenae TaxID=200324 RepID=A0A2N5S7V5_9BASI|nr:hypothetical protein PCANC_25247 [Puccinia coronata f. sp. avenae]PLW21609.1 hypothetical protein PCASD_18390 [Puccinia coronata f. sp. avenae]